MRKKTIPLHILKIIQDTVDKANKNDFILSEASIDALITLRDNDIDSHFYFKINSYQEARGKILYSIEYLPYDGDSLRVFKDSVTIDNVKSHLDNWLNLLSRYNLSYPLFDDTILYTYYNELAPSFEILEPDANTAPFNFKQQEYVINIYDRLIKMVLEEKSEENQDETELIIKQIESSKKRVSKISKKQAMRDLKKVLAYCQKYSYEIAKSIFTDLIVEIGKRLITGG